LLLALTVVTLAVYAEKPPERLSDEEVATLRERYPYANGSSSTYSSGNGEQITDLGELEAEAWTSYAILRVEVVSDRDVITPKTNSPVDENLSYGVGDIKQYCYRVKILEVIALNESCQFEIPTNEDVYIWYSMLGTVPSFRPEEKLVIFVGSTIKPQMLNEKLKLAAVTRLTFYETPDRHILSMSRWEGVDCYSGLKYETIKLEFTRYAQKWYWDNLESYEKMKEKYLEKIREEYRKINEQREKEYWEHWETEQNTHSDYIFKWEDGRPYKPDFVTRKFTAQAIWIPAH
jgi:hypothetical protein